MGTTLELTGPDGQPVYNVFGQRVWPTTPFGHDQNPKAGHGFYLFDFLPPLNAGESYTVTVPYHLLTPSWTNSGVDHTRADLTEYGSFDQSLDFEYLHDGVPMGDMAFEDLNGNGVQDEGEPGVEGATFTIEFASGHTIRMRDGSVQGPVTSDENGFWQFTDIQTPFYDALGVHLDSYIIRAYAPEGWRLSSGSPASIERTYSLGFWGDDTFDFGFVRDAEPVDPIEPVEPVEPVDPIEPVEPVAPEEPVAPAPEEKVTAVAVETGREFILGGVLAAVALLAGLGMVTLRRS